MSTTQTFLVLMSWYLPGAYTARRMARRGHDPLAWAYLAWIGGALCAVAALVWVVARPAPPIEPESTTRRTERIS